MELKAATPEKFMFPHFELLNWYAGVHLLEILKGIHLKTKNYWKFSKLKFIFRQ